MKKQPFALWLALAFIAACGPESPTPPDAPAESRAAKLSRSDRRAPADETAAELSDGRFTLSVEDSKLSTLLKRLARLAKFQLVGLPRADRILSLDAEHATIEAILAEILIGEPYALRYAVDDETGAHRLERLTIGDFESELARLRREDRLERRRRAKSKRAKERNEQRARMRDLTPEEREERRAERAREREERERDIERELDAADAKSRARGVGKLDPEEGDLDLLLEFSADPAPEVRSAAVTRLGWSTSHAASETLYEALHDAEPLVVIDALDAIAFREDPAAIPQILPLLDHPDPEIRQIAEETIENLEAIE